MASLEEKIKKLDETIAESEKSIESVDTTVFILDKGKLYKEHNKKDEAIKEFKLVIEKTKSFNLKNDAIFEILHIGILFKDLPLIKEYLDACGKMLENGGDWEKRNKLKVYEGLYFMLTRELKQTGKLFLQALMTFTNYELFDYKKFVFYTVITNIFHLDRVTLHNKIIENSDVLACIKDIPNISDFLESFYTGNYRRFFEVFLLVIEDVKKDFFLEKHANYFIKEMRIRVYSQFLHSFKSVTIDNMASSFGVTQRFIDSELSMFISQGRIAAKIDKVSGIIECTQSEPTVELYQKTLRESDVLLSKIHKLSKLLEA